MPTTIQVLPDPQAATRSDAPARTSLWDLYRFAYSLALRSLNREHFKDALRMLLEPCNYWRNVEVPAAINALDVRPGQKVLDIGSPKLPSVFIWYKLGAEVYATDLFPYFFEEYSHYLSRLGASMQRELYHIEQQDARKLRYPDNYFDKVYAISVLEHIEDEGDSKAMREIARVLKPGGLCCLTVPFDDRYRESTIDYEIYFKKPMDGKAVFYERHYDRDSLRSRLVKPSGLRLARLDLYGERWFHYEHCYNALPRAFKVALAPSSPLFSKLLLIRKDPRRSQSAQMALLELCKEAGIGASSPGLEKETGLR